jgi:anti-sigma B factor antagonist
MDIQDTKITNVLVIAVSGSIDAFTAPQISEHITAHINKGSVQLIADLKGVDYTSSAGLRVLLSAVKETRSRNGDIRLANIQPEVKKVLNLSGFSNILKIFPDVDSAINSFNK